MSDKKGPPGYLRYTSVGIEMLASVGICMGLGYGLDTWLKTGNYWFTAGLAFVGVVVALYIVVKSTLKNNK